MSIKYHSKNSCLNNINNKSVSESPKLTLEGHNIFLPLLTTSLPYNSEDPSLFFNIIKKHKKEVSQPKKQCKERGPVQIVGKTKKFQARQAYTGIPRKRKFQQEAQSSIFKYLSSVTSPSNYLLDDRVSQMANRMEALYYFSVGIGNNSQLIEKVLKRRKNWQLTKNSLFDFKWDQVRQKHHFVSHKKITYNHLPNHEAITDKGSLLKNIKIFCQKINEPIFNMVPACFELNFDDIEVCENQMKKFIQFFWENRQNKNKNKTYKVDNKEKITKEIQNENQTTAQIRRESLKSSNIFRNSKKQIVTVDFRQNNKKRQQIRQFHKIITSKLKQFYSFQDMSVMKRQSTVISPLLLQVYGDTDLWLLKPTDLNRGRGIKLFRSIQQLGDLLANELAKNQKAKFIVQKYIQKPLLICNRKFDIRVWAMVTHNKQVFWFKEGYLRTSCEQYSVDSKDQFTHLTNNAIQKYSKKYGTFEDGNQISLQFLYTQCVNKQKFLTKMKNYIKICFSSVMNEMFIDGNEGNANKLSDIFSSKNVQNKSKYFQIFGFDFMVDVKQHLWLIEVNTNPCLEQSSTLLKTLIPRMLDDAFKLTIDKIFSKSKVSTAQNPFVVQGYKDNQNMWQQIQLIQTNRNCSQLTS